MKVQVLIIVSLLLTLFTKEVVVFFDAGLDHLNIELTTDIEGETDSEKELEDLKEESKKINSELSLHSEELLGSDRIKHYYLSRNNIAHREITDPPPEQA